MDYRILVVCQRFYLENQKLTDICEGFIERGMKVDVLCGQPSFLTGKKTVKKGGYELYHGIRIFRVYESDPENRGSFAIFENMLSFRISSVAKLKELEKIRYDKIFIYQVSPVTMCAAGLKLGERKNLDVTMMVTELWPHVAIDELDVRNGLFRLFLEKLANHYYLQADKLIVNSYNTKVYFKEELHIPAERVVYIPQTAEKIYENTTPDNDLLERFAGSFKVVYTGEIGRKQRFYTVIMAARKLVARGIRNVRFIIVGTGPALKELKAEVQAEQLTEYFVFEGEQSAQDLPRYLNMADVLLDTRRQNDAEDFYVPSKLASYMAAGRPLLLAMGGDAKEIIKEADCGFVSEPEDYDTLFLNLMRLYKMSRKERRVLGQKAKEYQKEHFNRDRNIVRLMEEIHATKRQAPAKGKEDGYKDIPSVPDAGGQEWFDAGFKEEEQK